MSSRLRLAAIAADVHARQVPLDEMTGPESIDLLRNQLADAYRDAVDDQSLFRLASRVGEMPIMLELVGKWLNDTLARKAAAQAIAFVAEILNRKQINFFQRDGGARREDSIGRTIEASLEFLDEPGDQEAPPSSWGSFPPRQKFRSRASRRSGSLRLWMPSSPRFA